MGWSSNEWTGFLLRASGPLTDAPPSATMRRTVCAAAHVKSCCGLRLPCRLPGALSACDAPVSSLRNALRGSQRAVGGAFRAPVRVFGVAPDGRSAKPCRSESAPTVIPASRRRRRSSILPWQGATGARSDDSDDFDFDSLTTGFRQLRVQLVEEFREFVVRRSPFRA